MTARTGRTRALAPLGQGRLNGKVALVTGGGSGVGRAIALAFAREGARVAVAGRRAGHLARVVATIGDAAIALPADVSSECAVAALVAGVLAAWGRLDTLVNNAAYYEPAALAQTSAENWDRTLATNVRGPYLLVRAVLPALERSRGSVINVSSNLAERPVPGQAAYAVSKAALDMLTRVLAVEGAARGVRANSIRLGIIDTPIHSARRVGDRRAWLQAAARMHPLGKVGRPEEAAAAAVYLASDEARYTTGAILNVDGGLGLV